MGLLGSDTKWADKIITRIHAGRKGTSKQIKKKLEKTNPGKRTPEIARLRSEFGQSQRPVTLEGEAKINIRHKKTLKCYNRERGEGGPQTKNHKEG